MKALRRGVVWLALVASASLAAGEPADWAPLDAAVRAQIAASQLPGAVAVIGDAERLWLRRAWGWRARAPRPEPMSLDTVFDLASLTKVVCTTTAVLQLAERGRVQLDAPVAHYWPAFGVNGKAGITVAQLLSHSSGLRPGLALDREAAGVAVLRKLLAETPIQPPGTASIYSDVNFIALGMLVQRVSGQPLDRYCRRHVFQPLHMRDTGFRPPPRMQPRIAPTEQVDGLWLRGTVQDPTARRIGGVAGHAGLFGTAEDLARFAQALLRGGRGAPLSPASIAAMQRPHGPTVQSTWHGLGWQLQAPFVAEREALPPLGAVGHTGYTGTGLWIDFVNRRFVVLLASRLHADGRGDARPLRRQVLALLSSLEAPTTPQRLLAHDAAFAPHLEPPAADEPGPAVQTGIDVLRSQAYAPLAGRRIGLISNLSAIDRHGWRTLDRLRWAPGLTLVKVFSPEHGLYGDAEGTVPSGVEPISSLPLLSLYGETRRPTPEMLQGLDTLVFDLQDAGARFFTYIATMGEAMEAAAQAGLRFVVLDRPNPIRADRVGGPMLDDARRAFTAYVSTPVQHGMTLGELARFMQAELRETRGLEVDLQVIAMQGYRRRMWFDQTQLDWVPPSPNLRRVLTAVLYPGVAWIEGSNVSVGRGTERPFEWIGAPWISGPRLAQALTQQAMPGVEFSAIEFVPEAPPYRGRRCEGVEVRVTDRDRFDPSLLGAALVQTLHQLWSGQFQIDRTLAMIGSADALEALRQGADPREEQARWQQQRGPFLARRAAALLYNDR